jgi:hypothetical protein
MIAIIPYWLRCPIVPEWLTAVGTLGATALALVLALWGEKISRVFVRPKLSLSRLHVGRPDSEAARRVNTLTGADAGIAYFFRLGIKNKGNTAAHDVQVFLEGVKRVTAKGSEAVSEFTPMSLLWSYRGSATLPTMLPDMPRTYCDLAHVEEPMHGVSTSAERDADLTLDVEFPPSIGSHILKAGTYHFDVIVAAANCRPRRYTLEVMFIGKWFSDEGKMFDIGFKMRTV